MAFKIVDFDGVTIAPGGDYPYGDIKDDPGGTACNRKSMDDMFQFFQKLMANAGIVPNSLPDNITNGYQLFDAATPSITGSIAVSTIAGSGGVSGTITYVKNPLANTLQIRATLTAANAQNFTASPAANLYIMGTLPTGFRPAFAGFIVGAATDISGIRMMDDLNVQYIDTLMVSVDASGVIKINWIKPNAGVAAYVIVFDGIIPLY